MAALTHTAQRKLVNVRRVGGVVHLEDVENGVGNGEAVLADDVPGKAETGTGDVHLPDVL